MADCLFCRIVAGEIPSTKVYEDARSVRVRRHQPAGAHARAASSRSGIWPTSANSAADPESLRRAARRYPGGRRTGVAGGLPRGLQHRRASRAERLPRARPPARRPADGLAAGLTGGQFGESFRRFRGYHR